MVPSSEQRASAQAWVWDMEDPIQQSLGLVSRLMFQLSAPSSANIWGPSSPGCGHRAEGSAKILCRELSRLRSTAQGAKCEVVTSDVVLAQGFSCLIVKWQHNSMPSGKTEIIIPQLWDWAGCVGWVRIFFLPVPGCVACTKTFISLNLRSPKCKMRQTMSLSSQVCCEEVWDILCLPR